MEERITKQQLMKMYNVNRTTIEEWRKRFGLPMIEISSHKKYIRKDDLLMWENEMKQNHILVQFKNNYSIKIRLNHYLIYLKIERVMVNLSVGEIWCLCCLIKRFIFLRNLYLFYLSIHSKTFSPILSIQSFTLS